MVIKIVNEELVIFDGFRDDGDCTHSPAAEMTVIHDGGSSGSRKDHNDGKARSEVQVQRTQAVAGGLRRISAGGNQAAADKRREGQVWRYSPLGDKESLRYTLPRQAVAYAKTNGFNRGVFLDTAGRLHVDEDMMQELQQIKEAVAVDQTVLVVDAMTGQDAVNVATMFDEKIGIDGVILTKLDGDTRGGAALSIRATCGKPILYVGMGEKLSDLEQFYPDRMASRILGMGDVLSLIEKAQDDDR